MKTRTKKASRIVSIILVVVMLFSMGTSVMAERSEITSIPNSLVEKMLTYVADETIFAQYSAKLNPEADFLNLTENELIELYAHTNYYPDKFMDEFYSMNKTIRFVDNLFIISYQTNDVVSDSKVRLREIITKTDVNQLSDFFNNKGTHFEYTTVFERNTQPIMVSILSSTPYHRMIDSPFVNYNVQIVSHEFVRSRNPSSYDTVWDEWRVVSSNDAVTLRNECPQS